MAAVAHAPRLEARLHAMNLVEVDPLSRREIPVLSRTCNLSRHGVEVELDHDLPIGSRVHLSLVLGPEELAEVEGVVRHTETHSGKHHLGIELEQTSSEVRDMLDRFIGRATDWEKRARSR